MQQLALSAAFTRKYTFIEYNSEAWNCSQTMVAGAYELIAMQSSTTSFANVYLTRTFYETEMRTKKQ
jgi:hypothetical protein